MTGFEISYTAHIEENSAYIHHTLNWKFPSSGSWQNLVTSNLSKSWGHKELVYYYFKNTDIGNSNNILFALFRN